MTLLIPIVCFLCSIALYVKGRSAGRTPLVIVAVVVWVEGCIFLAMGVRADESGLAVLPNCASGLIHDYYTGQCVTPQVPVDARQFIIRQPSITPLITCKELPNRWACTTRDGRRFDIVKTAEEMKVKL